MLDGVHPGGAVVGSAHYTAEEHGDESDGDAVGGEELAVTAEVEEGEVGVRGHYTLEREQ